MAINIADKLHAATAAGKLVDAVEVDGLEEFINEHVDITTALDELKVALQGTDTTATLTAIKTVVSAIPTATYGDALTAIQTVVDALPKTAFTSQDKQDILQAIQDATPTIDFTEVLEAITTAEENIKEAMPTIPTDYAKQGSDTAATNTSISDRIGTPDEGQAETLFEAVKASPFAFVKNDDGDNTYTVVAGVMGYDESTGTLYL